MQIVLKKCYKSTVIFVEIMVTFLLYCYEWFECIVFFRFYR